MEKRYGMYECTGKWRKGKVGKKLRKKYINTLKDWKDTTDK